MSAACFIIGIGYFIAKLLYWYRFEFGMAPLMIGLFLFASVQLFFIGILGEYIGFIHTHVQHRPHVIERERINFEYGAEAGASDGGDAAANNGVAERRPQASEVAAVHPANDAQPI